MRKWLLSILLVLGLSLGGFAGTAHAQKLARHLDDSEEKSDPRNTPTILSYLIFSISALTIMVIVCVPSRRPMPTEE